MTGTIEPRLDRPRPPILPRPHDPTRSRALRRTRLRRRARHSRLGRFAADVPPARGRRLLRRRRAKPARGSRPYERRDLELPDAAAFFPPAGLRGLAPIA